MKIALITDAWEPQVNGVVTTLRELVAHLRARRHQVEVFHPALFRTRPCPGYAGIDLAVRPAGALSGMLDRFAPEAIHLATEGPLGWAARRYCLRRKLAFTTAFHTRFPEILYAALRVPLGWGYALFRHFHRPSAGVMVPTQGVLDALAQRGFRNLRLWTHGVDTRLFAFEGAVQPYEPLGGVSHPVQLYVGRVSYEKNIEDFLRLELPGTKVVAGVGPLLERLREKYPDVRWLGILDRAELARVYAAADVFVFPSRSETFGLVMLESMACGTPVAAYPEIGPKEVIGLSRAGGGQGGILDTDLRAAVQAALSVPRHEARMRALAFGWDETTALFERHLVPVGVACDGNMSVTQDVIRMSSNR